MLLSVIIVTKNPGHDIYLTLASLKALDGEDVEILIKDNSDSKSLEDINSYFHFRNFLYKHQPDHGIYDAMNQAVNLVQGRYVYFLNAGDQYHDCQIIEQLKSAGDTCNFVYGNLIKLKPYPRVVRYTRFLNQYSFYLKRVCHQAVVVRRTVFDQIGPFDTELPVVADYLFLAQMISKYNGGKIKGVICIYKGGGISYQYQLSPSEEVYLKQKMRRIYGTSALFLLEQISWASRLAMKIKHGVLLYLRRK